MELRERPLEILRREVQVMTKHLPRVADQDSYAHEIELRQEEIFRRTSTPRSEIASVKVAWESFTEAERLELAAWIADRV